MKIDFRLALPSLTAWLGLAFLLTAFEDTPELLANWARQISVFSCIAGLLLLRKFPLATFSLWALAAVCISLTLQSPFYEEVPPWESQDNLATGIPEWAAELRHLFTYEAAQLPGVGSQLISGLAVGDTSLLSPSLSEAMKTVSLTHITAVSGANCIIVTAGVSMLAGYCGAGRRLRIVFAIAALVLFVAIVSPQPSVIRASVMALLVLVSLYLGRPGSGAALLSSAVILILLWNPWWALEYGFILSVLAVIGLIFLSQPIARSLSKWMPRMLADMISLPLSAQVMCQPVIILLSPSLPVFAVAANMIATPAAPVATICGLLAFLVLPISAPLGHLLLWCAWVPAQWIGSTAEFFASLPGASIPWVSGFLGFILAAVGSLILVCALIAKHAAVRRIAGTVLVSCVVCFLGAWGIARIPHGELPKQWNVAVCDVGQGDALILRSNNHIAAIDVGRRPDAMQRCLSMLGISHVELLVLTHFDKDHVGGISALMGKVEHVISGSPENAEDEGILRDLQRHGAHIERGTAGLTGTLGAARWDILWPHPDRHDMQIGNPGSVTLAVRFPEFSSIFLGDLGEDSQRALMASTSIGHFDVVKVAHHGSADQYSGLYERLRPSVSLLSVGADNDYKHPRKETIDLLSELSSLAPRTDQDGLILISPAQHGLSVWTER